MVPPGWNPAPKTRAPPRTEARKHLSDSAVFPFWKKKVDKNVQNLIEFPIWRTLLYENYIFMPQSANTNFVDRLNILNDLSSV